MGQASAGTLLIPSEWTGQYHYAAESAQPPVPFTLHLQFHGKAISDPMSEPATFGDGSSPNLYANISGKIVGRSVSSTKTYDGTAGVNHAVQYQDTLSPDGSSMVGFWNIGKDFGMFAATAK